MAYITCITANCVYPMPLHVVHVMAHGDEASFGAVFQRALQGGDPKQVHLHVASTHERAGDLELTDAAYEAACKKFKQARRQQRGRTARM